MAFPYRWEIGEIDEEHRKISEHMVRAAQVGKESRDAQMGIYDAEKRAKH